MKKDFAGTYPIILDGSNNGKITVSREGLFWQFDASCQMQEQIIRLSVYGDGLEGYLGVMIPEGSGLKLTKKLSDASVSAFPEIITHAGRRGELNKILIEDSSSPPLKEEFPNNIEEQSPLNDTIEREITNTSPHDDTRTEKCEPIPPTEGIIQSETETSSPPEPEEYTECDVISPLNAKECPKYDNYSPPDTEECPIYEDSPPHGAEESIEYDDTPSAQEELQSDTEISPPPVDSIPPPQSKNPYSGAIWKMCPCPSSLFSNISAKSACGNVRGALVAETDEGILLAIPADAQINSSFSYSLNLQEKIDINNKKYKICKINSMNY